jgi:hypothetical protein
MKSLRNTLIFIASTLLISSCTADEKKDPNIWVTLADIKSSKQVEGFYVHFQKISDSRYDLMLSSEPLIHKDERLANEDVVIVPDVVQVYTEPNRWYELNYRKDSRNSRSFVRARVDGLIVNFPIELEFYDQDNNRRSIYLIKDLAMKAHFFPHY